MKFHTITISRETGSGGRVLGQKLSDLLTIPVYDKKLIEMTANESGFSEQYIEKTEESKTTSFLYNLYFNSQNLPVNEQIFLSQAKIIRELADQGPCIVVGRCADYVLRERSDCLNIFLYAPMEQRIARMAELYGEPEQATREKLQKSDKQRAAYYNHFTDSQWGGRENYHMMVSAALGIDRIAKLVADIYMGKDAVL